MVVVRIRLERYLKDTYMELHSKDVGPYEVLKKISSNAYVLDLPENMGISNIFNIEDLTLCSNPKDFTTNGGPNAHLPPTPRLKEEIEDICSSKRMHALYTERNNDLGGAMPNGVEMLSLTAWFKVAVSVTDSEGPEVYRSQCIGLVSGET
uniref:Tf2-1-like SH3-like domain-containing protein n=1 Tax=Vitis vinifera TaxID=29760 RepID=A5BI62_VITVI|nr:hypothetical protein VITISV_013581 [Vitis vinifera]